MAGASRPGVHGLVTQHSTAGGRSSAPRMARALATGLVFGFLLAACGGSPEVPVGADGQPDAVLEQGRDVYGSSCAQCHGSSGQGGRGKRLNDGQAEERYPEVADMIAVVAEGKGSGMPAFDGKLEPGEIEAVVRYIREVL